MKPERWQQVETIFQAALKRDPASRAVFLDGACLADGELRAEVESLLAAHEQAGSFIETPAVEAVAELLDKDRASELAGRNVGPYQIVARLGAGGMGEVYLAQDNRLGRKVALKVLPDYFANDAERLSRFKREARAASALNHPNVATIYEIGESGEAGKSNYIAMEYVEGQTLAARIKGQPLASAEIIDIATQIADALDDAHSKGITHRDIKPANVMLNERGQVKVLDFGLAKIRAIQPLEQSSQLTTAATTEPGLVMGTVQYMSPEQALGREVDQRSDLFSLGVVMYEMATGRLPFSGATATETIEQIRHSQPAAIGRLNYEVSAELERIIRKCLEKECERRYQSARDLLIDLKNLKRDSATAAGAQPARTSAGNFRRSALACLVALALVIALYFWRASDKSGPTAASVQSIAVLPFKPLISAQRDEYLELGMADTLITKLASLKQLIVRPTTAVRQYTDPQQDALAAGRALQVEAVLEGSIQRLNDRLRMTVRLINVKDGAVLWADKFDEKAADIFAVQDSISERLADALSLKLGSEGERQLSKRYTANLEAYQLYAQGRAVWSKSFTHAQDSLKFFNAALEKDPTYALAYAGLSNAYAIMGIYGPLSPQEAYPKAREAALKALQLDDSLAAAHVSLGAFKLFNEWDWQGAGRELKRAMELEPSNVDAHNLYGYYLQATGRADEAVDSMKRAHEIDPAWHIPRGDLATSLVLARRYDEAIQYTQEYIKLEPGYLYMLNILGWAYAEKGLTEQAIATFQQALAVRPNSRYTKYALGCVYAKLGKRSEALAIIKELQNDQSQWIDKPAYLAAIYTALDDRDQTFVWLERAYQEHYPRMFVFRLDPHFDGLRSDQRFTAFLRRVNLLQ
jgi:TolB-like protein/Flp pilus assembly protein TadD/predicted Ser/Thr protein kinase